MKQDTKILSYSPMERITIPRPVDRISFISNSCAGRVVLDLGAMDETAYQLKQGEGSWLHEEIAKQATRVIGVDNSSRLPSDGLATADNATIYPGDIMQLENWLNSNDVNPDVVVAGELIEHLENPLSFLKSLRAINKLAGRKLLLTTPNATAMHNCLIGLTSRESTHHDHLCILSFKTISTLLTRSGFQAWEIIPYYSRFYEMKRRNRGLRRQLVQMGESGINMLERAFPLMSFGYIISIDL